MENKFWRGAVGSLIGAIWLYTLADMAGSITEFINGILNPGGVMGMFSSLMGGSDESVIGTGDILEWLFALLVLFGYLLFYSSLSRFMRLQRSNADRMAVAKVRKGYIQLLVAILVGFIPLIGKLIALILTIVAYASMISGYKALRDSSAWTEEARRGAARLRAATIWILVGYIIGCLPFGGFIESLILFITFFVILSGWGIVRRGAPALSAEETAVLEQQEARLDPPRSTIPAWWFPTYIGLYLILCILGAVLYTYGWSQDTNTIFSQQMLDPQTFGNLTLGLAMNIIFHAVALCHIIISLYVLFSKKVILNRNSRIGICLAMVSIVISHVFPYFYQYMPSTFFGVAFTVVNLFIGIMGVTGILLFVWTASCNRTTKVSVTVYESLGLVGGYLLPILWQSLLWRQYGEVSWQMEFNFRMLCDRYFYLAINVIIFSIVLTATIRKRGNGPKQSIPGPGSDALNG